MAINTQIVERFLNASALKQYRDKWLSDDCLVIIMSQTFNRDRVNKAIINRAFSDVSLHRFILSGMKQQTRDIMWKTVNGVTRYSKEMIIIVQYTQQVI